VKTRTKHPIPLLGAVQIALAAALLANCVSAPVRSSPSGSTKESHCDFESFTKSASEHIVVDLDKPFRVRSVEGVIASQGGDWPDATFVTFEIRRADGTGETRSAKTDSRGFFNLPGVPTGRYCFKATVDGWQSVMGVLIVTQDADPGSRVAFEMPLGV
jgi:hypothetical protein